MAWSTALLAGIVAKGLGILAAIFGLGVLVGVLLAAMVFRSIRRRR